MMMTWGECECGKKQMHLGFALGIESIELGDGLILQESKREKSRIFSRIKGQLVVQFIQDKIRTV
jgi:hypothetical protein